MTSGAEPTALERLGKRLRLGWAVGPPTGESLPGVLAQRPRLRWCGVPTLGPTYRVRRSHGPACPLDRQPDSASLWAFSPPSSGLPTYVGPFPL